MKDVFIIGVWGIIGVFTYVFFMWTVEVLTEAMWIWEVLR